jgi:hypothetical protein
MCACERNPKFLAQVTEPQDLVNASQALRGHIALRES